MLQIKEPDLFDVIVSFLECKERQCHYPLSEPTFDMIVCGKPAKLGSPYCEMHHSLCRTAVKK